jgi:hypothetical protein
MNETKPSTMKPKKTVSKSVAIALGIICIILIASLGGIIASYTVVISNSDTRYNDFVGLKDSIMWVAKGIIGSIELPAGVPWVDYGEVCNEAANYSGYVSFSLTSTTSKTYARVVYSAYGANYNNSIQVGTSGTAYFPVLPSSSITVEVGSDDINGANITDITVTYYY